MKIYGKYIEDLNYMPIPAIWYSSMTGWCHIEHFNPLDKSSKTYSKHHPIKLISCPNDLKEINLVINQEILKKKKLFRSLLKVETEEYIKEDCIFPKGSYVDGMDEKYFIKNWNDFNALVFYGFPFTKEGLPTYTTNIFVMLSSFTEENFSGFRSFEDDWNENIKLMNKQIANDK